VDAGLRRSRLASERLLVIWIVLAAIAAAIVLLWLRNRAIAHRVPRVGDAAAEFTLPDQHGASRALSEFRGRWLVLYFYPRDDTPGCAEQAMRFRNAMRDIQSLGAEVCGVSVDSTASHAAFARKYNLPFTLLADRGGVTARRYGSLIDLGVVRLARRNTFLIDPDGRIARVYVGVNAGRNAQQVMDDMARIGVPGARAD
jgi:peroxiredoxin Q/BCP